VQLLLRHALQTRLVRPWPRAPHRTLVLPAHRRRVRRRVEVQEHIYLARRRRARGARRVSNAQNECVDPLACASACERARRSDVGGVGREARPRGEKKDEPRERESKGRSTFGEGGDASAMGACVGVADGAGVWAGLRGDDASPVMVTAVSDDAIDGGRCGRSGRVLIVYMLCDGRVSEVECYGRGGRAELVLDAHFVLLCTLDMTCQDAHSSDSTWPVLATPGERWRNP
jgi:hypothetical protein